MAFLLRQALLKPESLKMKHVLLSLMFLCLACSQSAAHALWVESNANGTIGTAQTVKVYFGEYTTQELSDVESWFSDLKDFTLILHSPDKKEIKLQTTAMKDHFEAVFTPEMEGAYTVSLQHTAKDLYYGYKLDYNSVAIVRVGTAPAVTAVSPELQLHVLLAQPGPISPNETVPFSRTKATTVKGEEELEVIAPNGWVKKLWVDKEGKADFVPLWPGKYMIEMIVKNEEKGMHHGQEYTTDFHCATYLVEVK